MTNIKSNSIDLYISDFPIETQVILEVLRTTINNAAPNAEEVISFQMPAFKLHGMLVSFAGHRNHIEFYPTPSAFIEFKKELSEFKSAKGSVQFPIEKPLPL